MNKRIIGIFLCIIIMPTYIAVAHDVDFKPRMNMSKDIDTIPVDEYEIPIWNVGEKWIYDIDEIDFKIEQGMQLSVSIKGNVGELPLIVNKVNSDSYELKFNAPISGSFEVMGYFPIGLINISGVLKNTEIKGDIIFDKADLGIKQVHILIDGRVSLKVNEIPIELPFPIIPPIPVPLKINLDMRLSNSYQIIDFPLTTNKSWGFPSTNLSMYGTVETPWLNFLGFFNKILRFPRVIPFLAEQTGQDPELLQTFSDIIYNLTPVLDIKYALDTYLGGNFFEFPELPPVFHCFSKDNIKVAGETFNAYNISLVNDLGNIYYHPNVGNILGIIGYFGNIIPFINNINAKLISYNYSP